MREYVDKAKLKKRGSCHLFRHTMATLILEGGADIRFIQATLGQVRVMRVHRDEDICEVRELSVLVMVEGDFDRIYTHADNSKSLCTDTMKNLVNVVAHENPVLGKEEFCSAVADRLLAKYRQVFSTKVTAHETKWSRLAIGGKPHPHSFVLDNNGKPFAIVGASRRACQPAQVVGIAAADRQRDHARTLVAVQLPDPRGSAPAPGLRGS